MMLPTVHLNGTSRDELQRQVRAAADALYLALDALRDAAPNGRDFYPQGADAINVASREHSSRLERVNSVIEELAQIAEHIA